MNKQEKKGQVSFDLERMKKQEAIDLGAEDFFKKRDKEKRGSGGLVEDTSTVLKKEQDLKQELYDQSQKVVSLPEFVKPMHSGVFLTAKRNKLTKNGVYLPTASFGKGSETDMDQDFSERQVVLSCGPYSDQLAVGWEVVLQMDNFKKRLESTMAQKLNKDFEYDLPLEIIDGTEYLYVTERDIKYVSNTNGISIPKQTK